MSIKKTYDYTYPIAIIPEKGIVVKLGTGSLYGKFQPRTCNPIDREIVLRSGKKIRIYTTPNAPLIRDQSQINIIHENESITLTRWEARFLIDELQNALKTIP